MEYLGRLAALGKPVRPGLQQPRPGQCPAGAKTGGPAPGGKVKAGNANLPARGNGAGLEHRKHQEPFD
jgi:hypothetical protein